MACFRYSGDNSSVTKRFNGPKTCSGFTVLFESSAFCIRDSLSSALGLTMAESRQGDRKFYELPENITTRPKQDSCLADPSVLSRYINNNIIGRNVTFEGPFGKRQVYYLKETYYILLYYHKASLSKTYSSHSLRYFFCLSSRSGAPRGLARELRHYLSLS